ncbi:MAG: LysR family transcriptional regulator [Solobacterium sp.]|nr:LysR family transcriptional regulator [Solobacterium sp.]
MIDNHHLVQILAVAEHGTLSEAARQLGVSQPALSKSMARLEKLLGVSLFVRDRNRLILNETGKLAVELFRQEVEFHEEILRRIRESGVKEENEKQDG